MLLQAGSRRCKQGKSEPPTRNSVQEKQNMILMEHMEKQTLEKKQQRNNTWKTTKNTYREKTNKLITLIKYQDKC